MFKNVTLTDDTVVDFGSGDEFRLWFGQVRQLPLVEQPNLTKRGSGSFQLQKRGRVTGDGNIIVEGQTLFENVDMSAGDPAKNSVIVRSQLRWWSSRYDKPINWKLRCEAGGYVNVQEPNVAAFNSYRLWAGPVESASGIALTNSVSYSDAAMTYSGNIALGGALALTSKGSVRLAGSSVSADSLDMRNGGLQLSPPSGSAMTFAKASQAYGFFDGICNGSTVMFGGTFFGSKSEFLHASQRGRLYVWRRSYSWQQRPYEHLGCFRRIVGNCFEYGHAGLYNHYGGRP